MNKYRNFYHGGIMERELPACCKSGHHDYNALRLGSKANPPKKFNLHKSLNYFQIYKVIYIQKITLCYIWHLIVDFDSFFSHSLFLSQLQSYMQPAKIENKVPLKTVTAPYCCTMS